MMLPRSIIVAVVALCTTSALARPGSLPRTFHRLQPPDVAKPQGDVERKVSSRLRAAKDRHAPLAAALVPADAPRTADGKLEVYIDCAPLGAPQVDALAQAGVLVDGVDLRRGRVRARLDDALLDRVADFSWVRSVRAVDRAVVRTGGITTEGDAAARADLVRAQGLDGSGVIVGVISDGIDNLRVAQQSGDLPDVQVPAGTCRRGSGDEGTALLEIVHDVAPGAQLLFAGPADSFEMVEAVECLLAAGADVIVDDLGFFGEPYFEDGRVAAAVQGAVKGGVSYHSSAGNQADEHLEQEFVPMPGVPNVHDFAAGAGDNTDTVLVPAGGELTCILQWNDPFGGSGNDYDLVLFDQDLNPVAISNDPQVGAQDPIEVVAVVNQSDTDAVAHVLIQRFAGDARRLELFCLGAAAMEHVTPEGSIVGHPALAEVVAVGAIDAGDPGLDDVEAFSSRGPARVDFPARQDRAKPDLAAFDGVAISNAGGFPFCPPACAFFGTSAAAPHTAGVAALLLQKEPSLTPAAVQAALQAGAADVGSVGFDDASGFGRLDALASLESVSNDVPPECTSNAECDDGDACTSDACDSSGTCVSTPLAGTESVGCRLAQLGSAGVCGPWEIDARTAAVIGKRVPAALALLDTAPARKTSLAKVARHLAALARRVSRAEARGLLPADCASTLDQLIGTARELLRGLDG